MVHLGQTAALFDVEKNDRLRGKTFALGDGSCVARAGCSLLHSISIGFQFPAFGAEVEEQETETLRAQGVALAEPSVGLFAERRAEPIAAEGKSLSQNRKCILSRENVAVETEIGSGIRGWRFFRLRVWLLVSTARKQD